MRRNTLEPKGNGVPMLARLRRLDNPIPIAIIGVGSMGKGLLHQCLVTPGIRCVALADIDVRRAITAADEVRRAYRVVDSLQDLHEAVRQGVIAVCEDGDLLARCELADAVVESTSSIIPAAGFAVTALQHRKHLVLMNSEIDLTFGPHLLQLARDNDVTYTSCDGDPVLRRQACRDRGRRTYTRSSTSSRS
jgi:predicted homoserine dehydrogenase-like protein